MRIRSFLEIERIRICFTVCPRSLDLFNVVSYYIKMVKDFLNTLYLQIQNSDCKNMNRKFCEKFTL